MSHKYYVVHDNNIIIKGEVNLNNYIIKEIAEKSINQKDLLHKMSLYYKDMIVQIDVMTALGLLVNDNYKEV